MALIYKVCGTGEIPSHFCNPCLEVEQGGLRGGAFILSSYIPRASGDSISNEVEDFSWWETGINEGKIHVIPKTRGTFDGGSPTESPGYGDLSTIVTGKTFSVVMNDPDHRDNEEFYAAIANAPGSYNFAWRTGTELRISDTGVNIDPTDPIEEDPNSQVVWTVNITWNQKRKTVQIFNLDNKVFSCFDSTGDAFYTMPTGFSVFSNAGDTKELSVISTVAGADVGFTISGTPPSWLTLSIVGKKLIAEADASNQMTSRYFDVVLIQDDTGKTLTRRVTQAASSFVPVGNAYAGGVLGNYTDDPSAWDLVTESDVKALILNVGSNPVKTNVEKGDVLEYQTGIGIMRSYVVVPAIHGNLTQFYDVDNSQNLTSQIQTLPNQITVDGVLCNCHYLQYMVPDAGTKNLKVTV